MHVVTPLSPGANHQTGVVSAFPNGPAFKSHFMSPASAFLKLVSCCSASAPSLQNVSFAAASAVALAGQVGQMKLVHLSLPFPSLAALKQRFAPGHFWAPRINTTQVEKTEISRPFPRPPESRAPW